MNEEESRLERWWHSLTGEEQDEARGAADTGQLTPRLHATVQREGVEDLATDTTTPDLTVSVAMIRYLKMRHD